MKYLPATLFSASLIASAAAHGYIGKITVDDGTSYTGYAPSLKPEAPSVIRHKATTDPVLSTTAGLKSPDLACGPGAAKATLMATVAAGAKMLLYYNSTKPPQYLWFHNTGPMITYLANCGSEQCSNVDAADAHWFKIQEDGKGADGWAQAHVMAGLPASVTIPANLKPGNYLLRHEIIALHRAQTDGEAEFYPNCVQLTVTGSGTGVPIGNEAELVSELYKHDDPGVLVNVYDGKEPYQFPGPEIAAFVDQEAGKRSHMRMRSRSL
ncbi:glycoside hydrolase [Mycena crocata]|nr:glycoside hydrolase [Mycena crocata]